MTPEQRAPSFQEEPILREAAHLGEILVDHGTMRDWIASDCAKRGWLTAHGRDPRRYLITQSGLEALQ